MGAEGGGGGGGGGGGWGRRRFGGRAFSVSEYVQRFYRRAAKWDHDYKFHRRELWRLVVGEHERLRQLFLQRKQCPECTAAQPGICRRRRLEPAVRRNKCERKQELQQQVQSPHGVS